MAHLIGGDANKKGNFYENKVVVSKFIDMLSGHYVYVQQETYIKDDETGVDILVEESQGLKIFFQCKSRNGIKDLWSISDLINAGIIRKAFSHTRKGIEFKLVSPLTQCHTLKDFCYRAKTFSDLRTFELNALGGNATQKEYGKIKEELLKQENVTEEEIFSFLNLFSFEYIPDDQQSLKRELENKGQILNSELAYNLLIGYVETQDKVGSKIYYQEIINYLKKNNVNFFSTDAEVDGKKIFDLQNEYKEFLNRNLINGADYPRSETAETIKTIKNNKYTVLTGTAGSGKSIVTKQVCDMLDAESIVYLPININNLHDIKKTYSDFSKLLGFSKGIVRTLSVLNPNKITFLILDQLDSIGWNSQMSSNGKDLCYNFVKESLLYENIHVLFVARNVEIKNIQLMIDYEQKSLENSFVLHEVVVNKLTQEEISKIAPNLSLIHNIRGLLSTIGNIKLFLALKQEKGETISNTYDLIDAFIDSKNQELINRFPTFNTMEFCRILARKMAINGTYSVSIVSLSDYSRETINELIKIGLLNAYGEDRIGFIHQIIYDFIIAQENYKDLENGKSVVEILKKYNDNFLEKFETIKQFMEILFQAETMKFYEHINLILFSDGIVYTIRRLAFDFINLVQKPPKQHITLVDKIITSKKYGIKYTRELSFGKINIVEHLINNGVINKMLKNTQTQDSTIDILLSVQDSELAFNLFKETLDSSEDSHLINRVLHRIDDIKSVDRFFNYKVNLIKKGKIKDPYINLDTLLYANIDRTFIYLSFMYSNKRDIKIRFDISGVKNKKDLKPLFLRYGLQLHNLLKTYLFKNDDLRVKMMLFDFNSTHFYDNDYIAIGLFVKSIKYQTSDVILSYLTDNGNDVFLKKATLINLVDLDISKAIIILNGLIDNNFLLHQNFYNHRDLLLYFEKVISKFSNHLDYQHFDALLEQVLQYKRPNFIEHVKDVLSRRKTYNIWTNYWGEEQKRFLNCLPDDRLDKTSKELKVTLNRRFLKDEIYSSEPRSGVRTYSVVSGLNKENKPFTRKTWIKILTSDKSGKNGDKSRKEQYDRNGNLISTDSHQFYRLVSDAAYENRELFVDILLGVDDVRLDYVYIILDAISSRYSNKECRIESTPDKILEAHKLYIDMNNSKSIKALINFAQNYEIDDDWLIMTLLSLSNQSENEEEQYLNEDKFDSAWQSHFSAVQSGAILALSKYISFIGQKTTWFDELFLLCNNSSDLKVVISGADLVYALCTFDLETGIQYFVKLLDNNPEILEYNSSLILIDHSISKHNSIYMRIFKSKWDSFSTKGKELLNDRLLAYYCFYGVNRKRVKRIIKRLNKKSKTNDRSTYTLSEIAENYFSNQVILNRTLQLINILVKNKNRDSGDLLLLAKKNIKFYHENGVISKIINNSIDRNDFDMRLFYLDDIFKDMPNLIDYHDIVFEISSVIIKKKTGYYYDVEKVVNWLKKLYWQSKHDKIRKKALEYIDGLQKTYGRLI